MKTTGKVFLKKLSGIIVIGKKVAPIIGNVSIAVNKVKCYIRYAQNLEHKIEELKYADIDSKISSVNQSPALSIGPGVNA